MVAQRCPGAKKAVEVMTGSGAEWQQEEGSWAGSNDPGQEGGLQPIRVVGKGGTIFLLQAVLKETPRPPKTSQPVRWADVQGRNILIEGLICPSKTKQPCLS